VSDAGWDHAATEYAGYIGDYTGIDASAHEVRPFWTDGTSGSQDVMTDAVSLDFFSDVATLSAAHAEHGISTIVATCPHCFNTIRNEYPAFDGHFRVIHHTQLLDDLLRAGRLVMPGDRTERVTYHDSCYLGRYNGIYDQPRSALAMAFKDAPVEMARARAASFCCGGGGGRVWMEEHEGRRVNQERVQQAMAVSPDILASACPFCLTMFEDGVKAKEVGDRIKTRDIAEVLAESLDRPTRG